LALTPGARLGVYEVTAPIGEGGMGQVYRARDTKLNRDVALKILPDSFATDPDRLARFTREAQTLASLNHPNIAHIHGLEESTEVRALVMELVEGEDLSQRIAHGPIPIDEVLAIAKQIAEALEAAHEQGIIHRDLKPANIKVRPDGTVKVLDFGLAKAMEPTGAMAVSVSMSPTITTPAMTEAGMILGTAAYMAPEQARGKTVDKRADIWAFGVVVFEMLTGRRAFVGDDVSITLASVMMKEPEWSALPAATPMGLRRLLTRCLKKEPKARMRDIGEARLQIEELLGGAPEALSVPAMPRRLSLWQRARPWTSAGALALGLVLIAVSFIALRRAGAVAPATGPVTFTIAPPENMSFGGPRSLGSGRATQVAVSPDGQNIVFVAGASSGFQIWLRAVATLATRPIPGTEGGVFPFWSPDSRSIGFFAAGKLKKVQVAGGPAIVLCDATFARGGSWSRDDVILFTPSTNGALYRVSSAGGAPTVVTTLDPTTGETNHRWPYFLPDGRHFLYTASVGTCCPASKPSMIRIGSLDPAEAAVTLFQGAESSVSYASGHLLFAKIDDEMLMAQPFDLVARQLKGAAFPLSEHVSWEGSRYVGASASENGTLVYAHGDSQPRRLTWFDRAGHALATLGDAAPYSSGSSLALSRDEQRVAVAQATGKPENVDIWIVDLVRSGPSRRQTFDPGADASPVWSPDGTHIAFSSMRSGKISLHQKLVNETAVDELLLEGSGNIAPNDWSADGRYIAFEDRTSGNIDLWVLPLFGDRKPFPLIRTEFAESQAGFAPNGHWIAYSSNEGGERNVFVQPFPVTGGKIQISRDGGSQPVWRADGRELFYLRSDGSLMAVPIDATGQPAGVPEALFRTTVPIFNSSRGQYAVTKDGKRFLTTASPEQPSVVPLTVVVNWTATIQK
jgi:Tol biopolymer transport system component